MLTLALARRIADAAIDYGINEGIAPLCVVVLDAGGHPLAVQKDERASLYRPEIAHAKAHACLGMGFGGREIVRRATGMPHFYTAVATLAPLVPVAGGVLVRDDKGVILGAVGISGDTADNDERCVLAGIAAAGLAADTGAPA